MSSILNYSIFVFYMLTAILIWRVMAIYTKNIKIYQIILWLLWLIAIILHIYSLLPIFDTSYNMNLSINHALLVVAFIISITLYISTIFSNTQFLGIIILPVVSIIFLLDFRKFLMFSALVFEFIIEISSSI